DCKTQEPREVADLMRPVQDDFFEMIPVSDKVNKVANIGADLIEPVPESVPLVKIKPAKDEGQMSLF
ncbi:hypothetical protein RSW14_24890, partial [Escherichia coli]|nr:hypothetical protein [Escherichia coli]